MTGWRVQPKLKGMSGLLSPDGVVYSRHFEDTGYRIPNKIPYWIHGELWGPGIPQRDIVGDFHAKRTRPGVKLYAFDVVDSAPFIYRYDMLWNVHHDHNIVVVPLFPTPNDILIHPLYSHNLEGFIYREPMASYTYGLTNSVLKEKFFNELTANVISVVEGIGKRTGMLGAFICKREDGLTDKVFKVGGGEGLTNSKLLQYFKSPPKRIVVRYEELVNFIPQCPQFVREAV